MFCDFYFFNNFLQINELGMSILINTRLNNENLVCTYKKYTKKNKRHS